MFSTSTRVSPDTVSVEIEEVISRNFPLRVETQQPADDSRRVLDINPEVSEVTVTGTRSAVDRVDRVVLLGWYWQTPAA